MSANEFREDLQWSESQHQADWWEPFYRKAFPGLSSIQRVPGPSGAQRAGVDKFVVLQGGKRIAVDEKIRRTVRPVDIALEYAHVPTVEGQSPWPGWVCKPNQFTDYMAVGFASFRVAFFFPFTTLQTAWDKHGEEWLARFYIAKSPNPRVNPRYYTHSVCVPTEVLMGCLLDAMRVQL